MIQDEGTIIECQNGIAKIQIDAKQACHSCKLCSREKGTMVMEVEVDRSFSPGDQVYIEIEGRNLLLCFFMLYLFPVISLITGITFGFIIAKIFLPEKYQEPFQIMSGFVFFGLSYYYIIRFDKKYKAKGIIKVNLKNTNVLLDNSL